MRTRLSSWSLIAAVALSFCLGAFTPTQAAAQERLLGFGLNFGVGFGAKSNWAVFPGWDDGDFEYDGHLSMEMPGFELRLFPSADVSIDFLWPIGRMVFINEEFGYGDSGSDFGLMAIMAHFYAEKEDTGDGKLSGFAIAPGMLFGGVPEYDMGVIGFLCRIGGDVISDDGTFGFGAYFRPAVMASGYEGGDPEPGLELMAEFTWTFYVPRPDGV